MLFEIVSGAVSSLSFYMGALICFGIFIIALKRELRGALDPLIPALITHSVSAGLVFYMTTTGTVSLEYACLYGALTLSLIGGFLLFRWHAVSPLPAMSTIRDRDAFLTVAICSGSITLVIMWIQYTKGLLPILSADPVYARFMIAAQNRWLSLIARGCHQATLLSAMLSLFTRREGKQRGAIALSATMLLIGLAGLATEGSKGALFTACFALGALAIRDIGIKLSVSRQALLAGSLALCSLLYVSFLLSRKNSIELTKTVATLGQRVVLAGDTYIYLFAYDGFSKLSEQFTLVTYVLHQFTAAFGLKLVPYNIGTALYGSATGDFRGFGPNPHHTGEGLLLVGPYLAPFYSMLIGYLTIAMRHVKISRVSSLNVLVASVMALNAGTASIDMTLTLFDTSGTLAIVIVGYGIHSSIRSLRCATRGRRPPPIQAAMMGNYFHR